MNCIKAIPAAFFIFFGFTATAQITTTSNDSVLMKLNITTFDDEKISTTVNFENVATHKITTIKTSKEGKVAGKFRIGESFQIGIAGSEDSYEYTIPDSDGFPLEFTFKYHLREKIKSAGAIWLFNNSSLKDIGFKLSNNSVQSFKIINDSVPFLLIPGEAISIQIPGVEISNNMIKPDAVKLASLNYVLYFKDDHHAELMPITIMQSAINIVYKDLYDKPVKGEVITIKGKDHSVEIKTAANGSGVAILPVDDHYTVSLKYFPKVFDIDIKKEQNTILANNLSLNYPSTKDFEMLKKEEAERIRKRDSLYKIFEKSKELNYLALQTDLKAQALIDAKESKKDAKYFEKKDNVVCAVLSRNNWPSKMIVTDVTASMYPYMKEVALWHLLELMDKSRSGYVFFNDGDDKPDNLKIIGKTGGIYPCLKKSPDSVLRIMNTAMQNGGGGDTPENDIESLIEASRLNDDHAALILIADNYSAIKDRELISAIKVPVRVVLCGTHGTWIHSDYLELAYRTGGSIHTIEEDIFNLSNLHNDDIITIGGIAYKFAGGRFFPLTTKL